MNITVNALSNATFSCSAFGYPAPSIMWYRQLGNGSLQQLTNTTKYLMSTTNLGAMNQTSVLTITRALLSDAGIFVCRAFSDVTNDMSTASLSVLSELILMTWLPLAIVVNAYCCHVGCCKNSLHLYVSH